MLARTSAPLLVASGIHMLLGPSKGSSTLALASSQFPHRRKQDFSRTKTQSLIDNFIWRSPRMCTFLLHAILKALVTCLSRSSTCIVAGVMIGAASANVYADKG
ncbi:expressed unknown protein [Seminavis robusta]|uniref:Uncharacterized protein n=1 Tax=Seminavis robusta TaxID=568900 RepID=A0A9N8DGV9_9STRA|nr:expressed unknown protein [Seminavis robusta]|eukprot:Sro114_g056231.1  (104) ;mRNA; r:17094-17405